MVKGKGESLLPPARGPVSHAVIEGLRSPATLATLALTRDGVTCLDPWGEDLQLALYLCYELHYRGFAGVDPDCEWDPDLLRLRALLEQAFLMAVRRSIPGGEDVTAALEALLVEDPAARGISHFLRDKGDWWQFQEYFIHRSVYHLKEADPHAWAIPRLQGKAKASLVAVEFDEYGGGRAERLHARLFADLMQGAGLDPAYGRYLPLAPAEMLAVVNLMSLFGLHRALRGALVGHFAAAEISTPPTAYRMVQALERVHAAPECIRFYTEHIEADAVHEQVMRYDVIADLLEREPELAADVLLGIQATELVESRFEARVLDAWQAGKSSLLAPIAPVNAG